MDEGIVIKTVFWVGFALLLCMCNAWGQSAVEQDRVQRNQIEREQQQREQLQHVPDVRVNLPRHPESEIELPVEQPCFAITSFELLDLNKQPAHEFEWVAKKLLSDKKNSILNKCIGAQGVAWLIDRGQKILIDDGFVTTRLMAGEQDLSQGHLTLTIVPGRIHSIRLKEPQDPRANLINVFPMKSGDLLNLRDIEQALENLKRVPTAQADIQIEPAQEGDSQMGESDLVVTYSQPFPLRLTLNADDSGTKETGKFQGATTLSFDNMFTLNDLFYFTHAGDMGGDGLSGPRGSQSDTYHYSLPYGYWLLGATFTSGSYYQSVAGATQNYIYSGTNANNEVKLTRMMLRDKNEKLSLSVTAFQRVTDNLIDGTEVAVQKRVEGGWSGILNYKRFINDATFESNLTYKQGTGAFGSLAAPEEAFGQGTSRFALSMFDANLAVPFKAWDENFRYNGTFRIQTNYTPLTPLDRFIVGGRYTVRGFDGESVLSAERGWLFRNDMSWLIGDSESELYAGLDHGEVGGPSSDLLVGTRLTGVAFGIRGRISKLNYDVFIAAPIKKPDSFVTSSTTTGFSLIASF
jgi:hemolysin activation/secretion protein